MIKCKPYGATFLKPDTCILKQTELAEVLKKMKEVKKRKIEGGVSEIKVNTPPVRYFALKQCEGCKVGIAAYHKFLKGD